MSEYPPSCNLTLKFCKAKYDRDNIPQLTFCYLRKVLRRCSCCRPQRSLEPRFLLLAHAISSGCYCLIFLPFDSKFLIFLFIIMYTLNNFTCFISIISNSLNLFYKYPITSKIYLLLPFFLTSTPHLGFGFPLALTNPPTT